MTNAATHFLNSPLSDSLNSTKDTTVRNAMSNTISKAAKQTATALLNLSDSELVQEVLAGSSVAFEAIMRRYNQRLFRMARSITKNDAEAEDVVQEAYLRAWKALSSFRAEAALPTWLTRIVANEALGRRRKKSADIIPLDVALNNFLEDEGTETYSPNDSPEQVAMRAQVRQLLEEKIDELPENFRVVFMLRGIEELSVEEVASILDIPEATVRTRFFRAKSLLRESLANEIYMNMEEVFSFDGARCDRIVAGVLEWVMQEGLLKA